MGFYCSCDPEKDKLLGKSETPKAIFWNEEAEDFELFTFYYIKKLNFFYMVVGLLTVLSIIGFHVSIVISLSTSILSFTPVEILAFIPAILALIALYINKRSLSNNAVELKYMKRIEQLAQNIAEKVHEYGGKPIKKEYVKNLLLPEENKRTANDLLIWDKAEKIAKNAYDMFTDFDDKDSWIWWFDNADENDDEEKGDVDSAKLVFVSNNWQFVQNSKPESDSQSIKTNNNDGTEDKIE